VGNFKDFGPPPRKITAEETQTLLETLRDEGNGIIYWNVAAERLNEYFAALPIQ
jgi:hypothetical protein